MTRQQDVWPASSFGLRASLSRLRYDRNYGWGFNFTYKSVPISAEQKNPPKRVVEAD